MFGIIFIAILVIGYFMILNSKVKNKGAILLEKTITAVLSTLVFSLYLAYLGYTPVEEQQANIAYISFEGNFMISLTYSLPVYLICGGLYSFFADIYLNKVHLRYAFLKYIIGCLVYLIGGLLIVGLFSAILLLTFHGSINKLFISEFFRVSALTSLLFYHISLISKMVLKFIPRLD